MLFRVYNQGEITPLPHGWRSVMALTAGRKWITVMDWATLESARLEIAAWNRLRPLPDLNTPPRKVRAVMRRRLPYVNQTRAIQQALRVLQEKTHDR